MEDVFSELMGNCTSQELPNSPLLFHQQQPLHTRQIHQKSQPTTQFEPSLNDFVYSSLSSSLTKDLIPSPSSPESPFDEFSCQSSICNSPPPSSAYSSYLDEQDTTFTINTDFVVQYDIGTYISEAQVSSPLLPETSNNSLCESGSFSVPSNSPYMTGSSSIVPINPIYNKNNQLLPQSPEQQIYNNIFHQKIDHNLYTPISFIPKPLSLCDLNNVIKPANPQNISYINNNNNNNMVNNNNTIINNYNQYLIPDTINIVHPITTTTTTTTTNNLNNIENNASQANISLFVPNEFQMSSDFLEKQNLAQEKSINQKKQQKRIKNVKIEESQASGTAAIGDAGSPGLTSSQSSDLHIVPSLSPNSKDHKSGKPKKLIDICNLFIKDHNAAAEAGNHQVYIDLFAAKYTVDLTRMYSILHVMKCIGIIEKRGHNSYHWIGMGRINDTIQSIYHSNRNYLTGEPEFVCEKCRASFYEKNPHLLHQHQQQLQQKQQAQLQQSSNLQPMDSDSENEDVEMKCVGGNKKSKSGKSGKSSKPSKVTDPNAPRPKLSHIYKQFIKQFFLNDFVSCKESKDMYNIQLTTAKSRRLYDMALILDSIDLITRSVGAGRNKVQFYRWKGSPTLEELKNGPCEIYRKKD